jgi:hypothetical protein
VVRNCVPENFIQNIFFVDLPKMKSSTYRPASRRYRTGFLAVPCRAMLTHDSHDMGEGGAEATRQLLTFPPIVESNKKTTPPSPGIRHGSAPGISTPAKQYKGTCKQHEALLARKQSYILRSPSTQLRTHGLQKYGSSPCYH